MTGLPTQTRGFTLVELLVGAAIAVIGLFASLTLAITALRGNSERRDSLLAGQLAEHLLATIQAEGARWTGDAAPGTVLPYLSKLPTPPTPGTATAWLSAPTDPFGADKRVGPLGADTLYDQGALLEMPASRGPRFCAHYRLIWVSADLARAEVRVTWPRPQAPIDKYSSCPVTMIDDVGMVGSVTLPALVMRNVYVQ